MKATDVHEALTALYDVAIGCETNGDVLRATRAYGVLVDFIADCQMPDASVEPEQIRALCRLFVGSGDMTPYALLKFDEVLKGEQ